MPDAPEHNVLPMTRLWNLQQVATYLGLTSTSFADRQATLEAAGMPRPLFGQRSGRRWDADAIRRWLDRLSGLLDSEHGLAPELLTDDALTATLRANAQKVANGD